MAILLGKSQCERRIPSRNDTNFITQFSTAHWQFIPINNNNLSHYYWQFITLTTVNLSQLLTAIYHNYCWQFITYYRQFITIINSNLISLSQFLMAHLSQRHGPCMDDKFHPAITKFYIIIINGTFNFSITIFNGTFITEAWSLPGR